MKIMNTRTSVSEEDYAQARRDYPHYAALCDAEDSLRAAKERLVDASVGMTGLLDVHKSLNAAIDAVIKRREELEAGIYPGVEYPLDMSALFQGGGTLADTQEPGVWRYYSRLRPIGPGTIPKDGLVGIENYDERMEVPNAGCRAWGHADYNRVLTGDEMFLHDLTRGIRVQAGA